MNLVKLLLEASNGNPVALAILGGLVTTLMNCMGAIPVLSLKGLPVKAERLSLGFAVGVMQPALRYSPSAMR